MNEKSRKKSKIRKQNEPLSSLIHLIGFFLSVAALVLLLIFAVLYGSILHVIGFSIFGASLILVYLASTLFHFVSKTNKAKGILQKIDHLMIYILIAGTYTPIALVVLKGWIGWSLFGVIWFLAIFGIILKLKIKEVNKWFFPLSYVIMGWLIIIAIVPFIESLPKEAIFWAVTGGIFYTLGVLFFYLDSKVSRTRWFGMHEIFHVFVIAGSFSHFWLMLRYVLYV